MNLWGTNPTDLNAQSLILHRGAVRLGWLLHLGLPVSIR